MGRKKAITNILLPAGWIFGVATRLRRFLYEKNILKSLEPPLATITIGNLAVGGTGKTPHSLLVIDMLKKDFKVAFLSRGYGRKSSGYKSAAQLNKGEITPEVLGDEPFMVHLRNPEIPLSVDADRYEGLCNIKKDFPKTDVVVLDDAFQHLRLKSGLQIVLTEYENPYIDDFPLPAGRLREFPDAAKFADVIVVTKTPKNIKPDEESWRKKLGVRDTQNLFFTKIEYQNPQPVTPSAHNIDVDSLQSIILLTGIAHPEPLVEHLSHSYTIVKHFSFQDHHFFSSEDLNNVRDYLEEHNLKTAIFTTEKDWARLQSENAINIVSLLPIFVVRIEVAFLSDEKKYKFNKTLMEYVRRKTNENRSNN